MRLKPTLQIKGREMKVPGRGKIIEIQIGKLQFQGCARIGHHVAPAITLQNDCQPRLRRTSHAAKLRDIDTASSQVVERDLTKFVVTNPRNKTNLATQCGKIVGHN